jgi:hypothetical protein
LIIPFFGNNYFQKKEINVKLTKRIEIYSYFNKTLFYPQDPEMQKAQAVGDLP